MSYIPSITLPSFIFEKPAASILLPVALGTAVGFSTSPKKTQKTYLELKQPPFHPPAWVFGPAWTALYASMGYAAYRAWATGANSLNPRTYDLTRQGATLYSVQLGLNLLWMPLFFGIKQPVLALVDILALGGVTTYMTYLWSQVDEVAGYALAPYVGWLGFATYLTIGVGYLNNWDLKSKEKPVPPTTKDTRTNFVNEKSE